MLKKQMRNLHNLQYRRTRNSSEVIQKLQQELNALRQNIKESKDREQRLMSAIPQIVFYATLRGEITYFNSRWQQETGMPVRQALGWRFVEAIHPKYRDRFYQEWQEALLNQNCYQTKVQLQQTDGSYSLYLVRAELVQEDSQETWKWVGTFTKLSELAETETQRKQAEDRFKESQEKLSLLVDKAPMEVLTKHKQMEAKLKESEERFSQAFESATVGMAIVSLDGRWKQVNRSFCEMLGYAEEELLATTFQAITPQKDIDNDLEYIRQMVAGEIGFCHIEKQYIHKQGNLVWVRLSASLVRDEQEKPLYFVAQIQDISQRKRAEQALRESEEKYRLIAENSNDLISIHTPQGIYSYVSPASHRLLGYQPEEMTGHSVYEFLHPDDALELQKLHAALSKCFLDQVYTYRVRCKDGNYVWLETTDRAFSRQNHGITYQEIISISRDISARKQAETEITLFNEQLEQRVTRRTAQLEAANQRQQELLEREQKARSKITLYERIVQNVQIGLLVWCMEDLNDIGSFRLINANPAATQMLDINLPKCLGKRITECFPLILEENRAALVAQAKVILSQQPKEVFASHYSNSSMCYKTFAIKIFPLPSNCVGVALEDITRSKRAENALKASEQRYRTVVNSVKEVIFQTNNDGCWTFLNPAWREITGFGLSESIGQPLFTYINGEGEKERATKLWQAIISGKREYIQAEFPIQTKTGKERWLDLSIHQHLDPNGQIIGTCGTLYDITDRKETQAALQARAEELAQLNRMLLATAAQLEKRNQELDQFAYVTSHDLKAPLRAIANLSLWLEEDLENCLTEDTKYQMHLLRNRVHRMEALINGLLEYSRVGRLNSSTQEVNVERLINEIIDSLTIPPEFTITLLGEMPTFVTQRLPLQQVLGNLISNAIKHHHRSDGNVKIQVRDLGQFYEFAIADDGPGIAPEYHDKVFVIFQTLEARDKVENTGVGLSIVKKTIENQGGTITIESEVGQGSTFRFTWLKK